MHIEYSAFILPHIGDKYRQCADRFSCGETNQCFAIADGVGNSLFPGEWAQLLCDDFIENPASFSENNHLQREETLIERWEEMRKQRVANLSDDEKFIYEMGLDKADFAASTFVGLVFDKKEWNCLAIGDSYLFLVDKEYQIIEKVASMDGHEFDNFPEYFASKKGQNNGSVIRRKGNYDNVIFFVLMTDALSDWFIEATPENRKRILNISNHSDFESFVNHERQESFLKDDDTTMLLLKIETNEHDDITFHSDSGSLDDISLLIDKEKMASDESVEKGENNDLNLKNTSLDEDQIGSRLSKIKRKYSSCSKNELKRYVKELLKLIDNLLYGTPN